MSSVSTARLSLVVSLAVLGLKYLAYALTGSVSLYSDALESVVNVAAAVVALLAVRVAVRPPDENHPYGHTKAEYLSAVVEGALILFAAVEIVRAAWGRFLDPVALEGIGVGLAVSVSATGLNAAWAAVLVRTGRRHRSPALVADGKHLWTDVVTTLGVLAGVGLASATGWWVLDPLLAIAVALNIVVVGLRLVRESVGGLMDERVPEEEMEAIRQAIHDHMGGAEEVHALRARHAGRHTFIEFHLVLPGGTSVSEAHAVCDRLEAALHEAVPDSSVTIHVEPEEKGKGHGGVIVLGSDVPHTFT
jgi:cation diffusion facilitator family transporter